MKVSSNGIIPSEWCDICAISVTNNIGNYPETDSHVQLTTKEKVGKKKETQNLHGASKLFPISGWFLSNSINFLCVYVWSVRKVFFVVV